MTSRLSAIALFAGAGGLDLGVEQAGYSVVFAVESDEEAVRTLNANRSRYFPALHQVSPADITEVSPHDVMNAVGAGPGDIDLVAGGPPCVAFSKSGFHLEYKRAGQDLRSSLLDDYVRFVGAVRPRAFIMENVYGLAYRNQSYPYFVRLRTRLEDLGYSFSYHILNAADYGVPQNRQRLFVIGSRDGSVLSFPRQTHWGDHERRVRPAWAGDVLPHVTAGEALRDVSSSPEPEEAVNGKYGHLLGDIPPGGNYLFYTAHEGHPNPLFEWRSRYWTFLLKLSPDRPAPTIQGQPGPYVGPFHWENRRLRAAELKRLHGFPDDYVLGGNRRQVQLQVGNAVPPAIGRVVANAVRQQLDGYVIEKLWEENARQVVRVRRSRARTERQIELGL